LTTPIGPPHPEDMTTRAISSKSEARRAGCRRTNPEAASRDAAPAVPPHVVIQRVRSTGSLRHHVDGGRILHVYCSVESATHRPHDAEGPRAHESHVGE
jgi:hypothetical protein